MSLNSTSKDIISLKINKVPSKTIYQQMYNEGLIETDQLYLVEGTDLNKFTFTAEENQSTFTIPFEFEDSGALTVYYNGVMMKENDNYTITNNTITLVDWSASKGDYITVMGIEAAAAIDVDEKINLIQQTADNAKKTIDTKVIEAIQQIDDKLATIPDNVTQAIYKNKSNTMTKDGRITMDSTYVPTADMELATKKYVDNSTPPQFSSAHAGTVPKSDGSTTKYLRADGTWTAIDKTPVIGTNTNYAIYIGTTAPASGTTPLLWIDTTSSTGFLKYRSSNTSAWTAVPVAWT